MGAWGPGIFSNDIASDVRAAYRELVEDRLSSEAATAEVIRRFGDATIDPDEATSFWTGLAACQTQLGHLQPDVRRRALEAIDGGADLHLWAETGDARKRKAALENLRSKIVGPQRAPVKLRRPRPIRSPVAPGDIFTLLLADGRRARFRTLGISEHRLGSQPIVELIDEGGEPYRQTYPGTDWLSKHMAKNDPLARWTIVSAKHADLPSPDVLSVVAHETPPRGPVTVKSYTGWRGLVIGCARILDDPDARPRRSEKS